jgi:hypothetical protein
VLQVVGVGLATFLSVVVAAVAVAQANVVTPQLGDIVSFKPGAEVPALLRFDIAARRLGPGGAAAACTLEPTVIARQGGSLVVEAALRGGDEPAYVVHWAGARTSAGAADCGTDAELVLSRADLENVARTAGGFGVDKKRLSPMLGATVAPAITN